MSELDRQAEDCLESLFLDKDMQDAMRFADTDVTIYQILKQNLDKQRNEHI